MLETEMLKQKMIAKNEMKSKMQADAQARF